MLYLNSIHIKSEALCSAPKVLRYYTLRDDERVEGVFLDLIQFNSIQFRHLYAPANKHHVGAHGEKATIIKYMNGQRKKINNQL